MKQEQFSFAHLSPTDLEQIHVLEKTLTEQKGEPVILVAYQNKQKQ